MSVKILPLCVDFEIPAKHALQAFADFADLMSLLPHNVVAEVSEVAVNGSYESFEEPPFEGPSSLEGMYFLYVPENPEITGYSHAIVKIAENGVPKEFKGFLNVEMQLVSGVQNEVEFSYKPEILLADLYLPTMETVLKFPFVGSFTWDTIYGVKYYYPSQNSTDMMMNFYFDFEYLRSIGTPLNTLATDLKNLQSSHFAATVAEYPNALLLMVYVAFAGQLLSNATVQSYFLEIFFLLLVKLYQFENDGRTELR